MKNILKNKTGESNIKTAVIIILAVVIGGIILGGVYLLFQNVILPRTADNVESMLYIENAVQVRRTSNSVQYSYDGTNWKNSTVPGLDGGNVTNLLSIGEDGNVVWVMTYKSASGGFVCSSTDGKTFTPIYSDSTSVNISKSGGYIKVNCNDGRGYRTADGVTWEMTSTKNY